MRSNATASPRVVRHGFTLVELLVVIAIIGVLMALLLPAVQSAREGGRRTQCNNNQYQMAMAVIRHGETNGYVPGWRNAMQTNLPPPNNTIFPSWTVSVLPFLERTDVITALTANPNAFAAPYLSFYSCPSTPSELTTVPALAYAGNCGSGYTVPQNSNQDGNRWDGVMVDTTVAGARIGMDDVSNADGTAMTLLLSEKCGTPVAGATLYQGYWDVLIPAASGTNFAFVPAVVTGPPMYSRGAAVPIPAFGITKTSPPTKIINNGSVAAPGMLSQPSSNHPGGAVVAYCDGHTGLLKDSIAANVYAQALSWSHTKSSGVAMSTWGSATKFPLSDGDLQ